MCGLSWLSCSGSGGCRPPPPVAAPLVPRCALLPAATPRCVIQLSVVYRGIARSRRRGYAVLSARAPRAGCANLSTRGEVPPFDVNLPSMRLQELPVGHTPRALSDGVDSSEWAT